MCSFCRLACTILYTKHYIIRNNKEFAYKALNNIKSMQNVLIIQYICLCAKVFLLCTSARNHLLFNHIMQSKGRGVNGPADLPRCCRLARHYTTAAASSGCQPVRSAVHSQYVIHNENQLLARQRTFLGTSNCKNALLQERSKCCCLACGDLIHAY